MYLKCVEGDIRFNIDDVIIIESDRHRNRIITYNDIYHIYCKLDDLELLFYEYGFIRVHKSYLVNIKHMKKICNYKLTLDNNITVSVPRARFQYVKKRFYDAAIKNE